MAEADDQQQSVEPDGTADQTSDGASEPKSKLTDAEYWRAETKKVIDQRDKANKKLRELTDTALTSDEVAEYRELKEAAAKADEDRKKKAGEFDSLRQQLVEKHAKELTALKEQVAALETQRKSEQIRQAFLAATDLFGGGPQSKTILTADFAEPALRQFVSYEPVELLNGQTVEMVVVRDADGQIIRGDDGNPAPFPEAMEARIRALPNKAHILRGSTRTGSGNSGGSDVPLTDVDYATIIDRAARGDVAAQEMIRRRHSAAGSLQQGWGGKSAA